MTERSTRPLPKFNFEGLESGVKVLVFYTEVNGKRMINDLELVE
jgi:hypothetical protein